MAKKRKKRRKYHRSGSGTVSLGTTPEKESKLSERTHIGLTVLSFAVGQALGAAAGKISGYLGSVITGVGVWKKNMYATSFGAGMSLSEANGTPGYKPANMWDRSVGYAKNVLGKFTHPMGEAESTTITETATNGLGEGTQQPKYFLNPYTQNTDFSQAMRDLEKIETQVREVSGIEDDELNASERNY